MSGRLPPRRSALEARVSPLRERDGDRQRVLEVTLGSSAGAPSISCSLPVVAHAGTGVDLYRPLMHLDARLEVVPGRVAAGNSLDFVIHNTGTDDLLAGRRYWLERFHGEHWVEVRWYTNWTLEAYSISPGDAWTQRTRVPADVSPGSFRVIKTLAALVDEDDCLCEEVTASGAFEVVELR